MKHDQTEAFLKLAARLTAVEAERDQLRLEISASKSLTKWNAAQKLNDLVDWLNADPENADLLILHTDMEILQRLRDLLISQNKIGGDLDYPAPNNHDHTKRGFDPL